MENPRFLKHFLENQVTVKGYLLAATGKVQDAEDLVQAVWTAVWSRFDQYDEARPFRAWALGVARMEVLKWRQRLARGREVLSDDVLDALTRVAAETGGEDDTWKRRLQACLERLAEKARHIVGLRYGKAVPIEEIARSEGKNAGAIKMILARSRRALRDCLEASP